MGGWIDGQKERERERKELRTVQFVLNMFEKNLYSLMSKW